MEAFPSELLIKVHTTLYNSAFKKIILFIFAIYQNYPLALILMSFIFQDPLIFL